MKDNRKKSIIHMVIMSILIAATFRFLFREFSLEQVADALRSVKMPYIAAGLAAILLYVAGEGLTIRMTMRTMGQDVPLLKSIGYSFIGFYFSAITPSASGGQPAQIYWMSKDRWKPSHATVTLLIISAVYQISMLGYGLFMYVAKHSFLQNSAYSIRWLLLIGILVNGMLVMAILAAVFSKRIAGLCIQKGIDIGCRLKLIKDADKARAKGFQILNEYAEGAGCLKRNPGLLVKLFVLSVARLTLLYLIPFLVYKGFGLSGHSAMEVVGMQALLTIAVSSLPLPGSVGASEGTFLLLFRMLFSGSMLLPAMLLSRGIGFYAALAASAIVVLVLQVKSGWKKPEQTLLRPKSYIANNSIGVSK